MSESETTEVNEPSLSHEFEKSILKAAPARLEGTWVRFDTRSGSVAGEIIEVYDSPDGTRRISIEKDSGVVKAIPLWFLDGVWEGFNTEKVD